MNAQTCFFIASTVLQLRFNFYNSVNYTIVYPTGIILNSFSLFVIWFLKFYCVLLQIVVNIFANTFCNIYGSWVVVLTGFIIDTRTNHFSYCLGVTLKEGPETFYDNFVRPRGNGFSLWKSSHLWTILIVLCRHRLKGISLRIGIGMFAGQLRTTTLGYTLLGQL